MFVATVAFEMNLELPIEVGAQEDDAGVLVLADEIAASAERHRCGRLSVDVERAAVCVFGRKTPAEGVAASIMACGHFAHAGRAEAAHLSTRAVPFRTTTATLHHLLA
jgi:hypothetical protein